MVDIIAENTAVCNSEGKSENFKEKTGNSRSTPAGLGQSGAEHLCGPGRAQEPGALAEGGAGGDHVVHQKDAQPGELHALSQAIDSEHIGPGPQRLTFLLSVFFLKISLFPSQLQNTAFSAMMSTIEA